jgi:hypothetical protein
VLDKDSVWCLFGGCCIRPSLELASLSSVMLVAVEILALVSRKAEGDGEMDSGSR